MLNEEDGFDFEVGRLIARGERSFWWVFWVSFWRGVMRGWFGKGREF